MRRNRANRPTVARRADERPAAPVLFASFADREPAEALARAVELASRFDAPLSILLVSWDDALSCAVRTSEGWFEERLPTQLVRRYHHVIGHLVHEAIHAATTLGARIVVLPAEIGQSGSCVSAIAASAGVPVLIARAHTARDAIVAATALRDNRFPVVQQAAMLVDHFDTRLVGVHDLEGTVTEAEVTRRLGMLAMALEPISLSYEVVIDCEPDPADAVLAAARMRSADLIVVGVPRRTWLDTLQRPTVASRIIAAAQRSVLLVPIESLPGEIERQQTGESARSR